MLLITFNHLFRGRRGVISGGKCLRVKLSLLFGGEEGGVSERGEGEEGKEEGNRGFGREGFDIGKVGSVVGREVGQEGHVVHVLVRQPHTKKKKQDGFNGRIQFFERYLLEFLGQLI